MHPPFLCVCARQLEGEVSNVMKAVALIMAVVHGAAPTGKKSECVRVE